MAGVVAASVRMVPSMGPTQGVHPAANAKPNTNDRGYEAFSLRTRNFFSTFSAFIRVDSMRKEPNPTMMIPPIWFSVFMVSPPDPTRTLFMATPSTENTTENPSTKNTEFSITLVRFILMVPARDLSMSYMVVPDMYAKNAGIMGSMHGAKNEPRPAKAATARVTSTMICRMGVSRLKM